MADELLDYYNDELAFVRELAGAFAEANPAAAGRLRLTRDAVDDPHVERLIEAFAFLTARVRRKLDDDFPELTDAVLQILYPHYLRPIPSMTILRFQADPELTEPYEVAAGTEIDTEQVAGGTCRFRTTYPATLWPIRLSEARLLERPYTVPPGTGSSPGGGGAASAPRHARRRGELHRARPAPAPALPARAAPPGAAALRMPDEPGDACGARRQMSRTPSRRAPAGQCGPPGGLRAQRTACCPTRRRPSSATGC